jgi:hypothetical protein
MKMLFRLTVLALAAVGARSLYERYRPRVEAAGEAGARIGDTVKPAFREVATTVKDASTQAVQQVADATHHAVDELADAATAPTDGSSGPDRSPGTASDRLAGREPLSAMAASDPGVEDGEQP